MEFDLERQALPEPALPKGYYWVPWSSRLLERHAAVKFESFNLEIDSRVFPCLAALTGCRKLMAEISRQNNFLPLATWLITRRKSCGGEGRRPTYVDCGTIQGMASSVNMGAVQNVGVVAEHRGLGLGRALVSKALEGFRLSGMRKVYLEVTAENEPAVELYKSIGFQTKRTMFKPLALDEALVS